MFGLLQQFQQAILIPKRLGMHQRHQDKGAQVCIHMPIKAALNSLVGKHQGQGIGGEHMGCVTKGVSRQLVQQQNQSQRSLGCVHPAVQLAPRRCIMGVKAGCLEGFVKCQILGEPFFRTRLDPEIDDIGGGREGF